MTTSTSTVVIIPSKILDVMADNELTKSIKVSEQAHAKLNRACLALFGTTSVRYSDAIEQFCDHVIAEELNNDND